MIFTAEDQFVGSFDVCWARRCVAFIARFACHMHFVQLRSLRFCQYILPSHITISLSASCVWHAVCTSWIHTFSLCIPLISSLNSVTTPSVLLALCTYPLSILHFPGLFLPSHLIINDFLKHVDIYTYTRHTRKYRANMYRLYNGDKENNNTDMVKTRIYKQSYRQTFTTTRRKEKEKENQAWQQQ